MVKLAVIAFALAVSSCTLAQEGAALRTVDLRAPHALDRLQTSVNARDVDLSRHLIRTSNPPKQLLAFTLDDVRYIMHVTRSDMAATVEPAK